MKIKRADIDAAIAVEVMGWDYPDRWGHWYVDGKPTEPHAFTPSTDANHALEALEKWCVANNQDADIAVTTFKGSVGYDVSLVLPCLCATHKSLATAICLALLSAVRDEQVEVTR